ncbi:hypothetical protein [Pimelobacter sp. 30-1]|uniref:hypothetical protein n=1 Tax=Pimelobacter sp. 30-1 TaxID=2004991 RepID=UPI001C03AC23|nr:hypothetical protein [Pimelobacter sp. 30-1]MBU2696447.1 hypothetical protein [Pimelobacter sp. 30-1]
MRSLVLRATLAVSVLLLVGAALVTFLPASPENRTCGTWVDPEWDKETAKELAYGFIDVAEEAGSAGLSGSVAENLSSAKDIADTYRTCDDALDTRRTWTFILLGAGLVVPVVVWFVVAGRLGSGGTGGRRPPTAQA